MKILKASSNVKSYWSCEFFIKLVSKYETPIFGSIDSEVGPKIKKEPNSLNEVLELHGVTSNLRAIQSKEEFEVRRRVEEILANKAPSIKQQTSLHKIFWYRIWLFLVLQGVLKKDSFIEHYASWRENKGARYFEVLCSFENQATYQKSIPIDIFLLSGIPSKEEIEAQIELAEPLISRPLIKNKNKRSIEKIVGRKNLEDIKISSRPCKIHRNIQPSDPQRVLRACVAIASAAAQIHSRASRGAKSPLRPKRTIARSSQRML